MADEDFPDEDFDDLPLDELNSVIYQESTNVIPQSDIGHKNTPGSTTRIRGTADSLNRAAKSEQHTFIGSGSCSTSTLAIHKRDDQSRARGATAQSVTSIPFFSPEASKPTHESKFVTNNEGKDMDEDMDFYTEELDVYAVQSGRPGKQKTLLAHQTPSTDTQTLKTSVSHYRLESQSSGNKTDNPAFGSPHSAVQGPRFSSTTREAESTVPAVTLTSPPFTYLCLLEELISKPDPHTTEIRVKAFIVTLLGKLSSNNGVWRVCATISDGTGYLDVELSDKVLTGLLGFSVAEKELMKRDPARRGELDAGMKRCQEELVDMCCVMTIVVKPAGKKAVVTEADPVNENVLEELEKRVRDWRK